MLAYLRRVFVVLFIVALVCWPFFAFAHSWYEEDCCHDQDCGPVAAEDVEELANGDWRYIPENKVFSKADGRVRPSRDGRFHVCLSKNARWPYCIYIVQGT